MDKIERFISRFSAVDGIEIVNTLFSYVKTEDISTMICDFYREKSAPHLHEIKEIVENYVVCEVDNKSDAILVAYINDIPVGMIIVSNDAIDYFDTRNIAQISSLYIKPEYRSNYKIVCCLMAHALEQASCISSTFILQTTEEHIMKKYKSLFGFRVTDVIYQLEGVM